MTELLTQITKQLGSDFLGKMSKSLGSDNKQTETAMSSAIPFILKALGRNASKRKGAESLANALDKDHDGGIFDNIEDLLMKPEQGHGSGILKHILGNKRRTVEDYVSKNSGMKLGSTGKMLEILAPIILGQLGKQKKKKNLDAGGMGDLLGGLLNDANKQSPKEMSMIEKMLDVDNDGSITDDLMRMGGKLLGGFFRK